MGDYCILFYFIIFYNSTSYNDRCSRRCRWLISEHAYGFLPCTSSKMQISYVMQKILRHIALATPRSKYS